MRLDALPHACMDASLHISMQKRSLCCVWVLLLAAVLAEYVAFGRHAYMAGSPAMPWSQTTLHAYAGAVAPQVVGC